MNQASEVRKRQAAHSTPERIAACKHNGLYWYAAPADERGWVCVDCGWSPGEEPGYSPEHDRSHIATKVGSILHDMHEAGIIYVSNGSAGEGIEHSVAAWCRRSKTYDSVSIAARILASEVSGTHATFWRDRGESIIAGKDNRDRCRCGKLAKSWRGGEDGGHFCSAACDPRQMDLALKGVPF
jgi:hypothetical protein